MELLARKMAGEATTDELEQLKELISRYPDSIYYEEILKEIWQDLPVDAEAAADIDQVYAFHQLKFQEDFRSGQEEYVAEKYNSFGHLAGTAVGILFVLLVAFTYWNIIDKKDTKIQIVAGKGIRKKIKLPDGTLVWLNGDSRICYAADFNHTASRQVYLAGEAFFDVTHQANHPFIVRTEKISVKVLGTAFNIQAYPKEVKSETTLLRGSIELSVNDRSGQKVVLCPAEKFAYVEEKKELHKTLQIDHVRPVKIGKDEYIEETSWKDNQLVFQNESFEELKPKLERWFNVQIQMASQTPKAYRFTGVFTKEDIKEALTAMQLIKPFTFKIKAHDVMIY